MGNQEPYGAGSASPRPAWANWLIVCLVALIAAVAALVMGAPMAAAGLGAVVFVCLIGAGISALSGVRKKP